MEGLLGYSYNLQGCRYYPALIPQYLSVVVPSATSQHHRAKTQVSLISLLLPTHAVHYTPGLFLIIYKINALMFGVFVTLCAHWLLEHDVIILDVIVVLPSVHKWKVGVR